MSTQRTACEENPEQWFIEKDGKQYRDDDLTTRADVEAAQAQGDTAPFEEIWDRLEREAVRANKIARRHAREACHVCPVRLRCLSLGLQPENLESGIWGGYYAEERQEIDRLRQERESRRARARE